MIETTLSSNRLTHLLSLPPESDEPSSHGILLLGDLGCIVTHSESFLLSLLRAVYGSTTGHVAPSDLARVLVTMANTEPVSDIATQELL